MSLAACLASLRADRSITSDQEAYIADLYDRLRAQHRAQFADDTADALASADTIDRLKAELLAKKKQALLQIKRKRGMLDAISTYRGRPGRDDFGRGAVALLVRDERAPYLSVEYKEKVIRNQALGMMTDVMERHKRDVLGRVQDKAGLDDLMREARGEDSGNPLAKEFAQAWLKVAEWLRLRANAAGANIGAIQNWGGPQYHDAMLVRRAGREKWKAAEMPRLDWEKITDRKTGKPFAPDQRSAFLDEVWKTIATEGWSKRTEGAGGRAKLADRMSAHRVLIYKSADDWLASNAEFGGSNIYDAMMGFVHAQSRDIALMETLGPNPEAGLRWLQDVVRRRGAEALDVDGKADETADAAAEALQRYHDTIVGADRAPVNKALEIVGSSLRGWQVTTKLGSAVVSAIFSDIGTQILTRRFNGLPAMRTGLSYLQLLASSGDRQHMARLGFIADEASAGSSTTARFLGQELTGEWIKRLAEGTMRASGMNAVTVAGRQAFGRDFLSAMTQHRQRGWDALEAPYRQMWARSGLGAAEWDAVRASPLRDGVGAPWITFDAIGDDALRDRVMGMALMEMDMAVIDPGVRQREIAGRMRSGTWVGEVGRLAFQFKTFPMSTVMMHGARMMAQDGGFNRARYAAAAIVTSTVAGYMALQAKEMLKGRDPRKMDAPMMGMALLQGGGLGIYGDFLKSTTNRFGGGLIDTLAGPSFQTLDSIGRLTAGAVLNRVGGEEFEDMNYGRALVRALKSEAPVAGSMWYTRLAFERVLMDQLQEVIDPKARGAFRRMERRYEKDYDQEFWWAPGEMMPDRAPDMGMMARITPT